MGLVTDVNQAVVQTASVTVIDVDTGIVHVYKTNSAGLYAAPFLIPGHYEVDATAPNFGKVEEKGITLLVGQTLTINLTLKVSAATTTVEVSGANEILDTEKTEVSQVVDQHLIQNMPVNARNWSAFVLHHPQRHPGRRLRPRQLPRHQRPLQPELRRRLQQQPDALLRGPWPRLAAPPTSTPRLHQGVPGRDLQLLGRVRPGRRRTGQRHHQERHQRLPRRPLLLPALSRRSTRSTPTTSSRRSTTARHPSCSPSPSTSSNSSAAPSAAPSSRTGSSSSSPTTASARSAACFTRDTNIISLTPSRHTPTLAAPHTGIYTHRSVPTHHHRDAVHQRYPVPP